ncbi:MAG TPA: OsmC family protein [Steroidobacteraceae bacterium]|jgi:putative redox protein|nr:OsmC family protein [Steroidobacteraceae bacterium]
MAHVTVTSEHHFAQLIATGHHRLTSDEPIARGGSDSGASPHELLLASLGACTSITLRMYAGRKDWELGKITVGLRYTAAQDDQKGHIDRRLSFSKPLTAEQTQRLLEIAGKTPVTRTLMHGVTIDTTIIQ